VDVNLSSNYTIFEVYSWVGMRSRLQYWVASNLNVWIELLVSDINILLFTCPRTNNVNKSKYVTFICVGTTFYCTLNLFLLAEGGCLPKQEFGEVII
jgi:hypothetical protein